MSFSIFLFNYLLIDKVVILKNALNIFCCCRSNKENDKVHLKIERIIWFGIFHIGFYYSNHLSTIFDIHLYKDRQSIAIYLFLHFLNFQGNEWIHENVYCPIKETSQHRFGWFTLLQSNCQTHQETDRPKRQG